MWTTLPGQDGPGWPHHISAGHSGYPRHGISRRTALQASQRWPQVEELTAEPTEWYGPGWESRSAGSRLSAAGRGRARGARALITVQEWCRSGASAPQGPRHWSPRRHPGPSILWSLGHPPGKTRQAAKSLDVAAGAASDAPQGAAEMGRSWVQSPLPGARAWTAGRPDPRWLWAGGTGTAARSAVCIRPCSAALRSGAQPPSTDPSQAAMRVLLEPGWRCRSASAI